MHPQVYFEFRCILREHWKGGSVLEVGAAEGHLALLDCKELNGAIKTGLDLSKPVGATAVQANANDMTFFKSESFDAVLCNAVLEHDKKFWLSCAEMRRVLKKGGLLILGVPGFVDHDSVLGVHNYPSDYYRFSTEAVREVFFEGMTPEVRAIMQPPRIIGWAIKS
jgi:ubiquinone/menaquinone biosynthesis C-methylase UbiE